VKRMAMVLVLCLAVSACGHPGIPAAVLRPVRVAVKHPAVPGAPLIGVDLYALSNYPAPQVESDGRRVLAYIKDTLRATAVGIVWNFYATGPHANAVKATSQTLSPGNVAILTRLAHQDHLLVEYRPLIMVLHRRNAWEGTIAPTRQAQWFDDYYQAELPYLKVAQRLGINEFVTATEMDRLDKSPLWPSFFARVAHVYHGRVSYAAWDQDYFAGPAHLLPAAYLGMDMYSKLRLPPSASSVQVTHAWESYFAQMPASVLRRTAIEETGIEARAGAYANPPSLRIQGQLDAEVQANWYTAACETVHRYHLRGVFFWKVDLTDYPARPATSLSTFEGREGAVAISRCAQIAG
jgi:hypothetical protein